VVQLLTTDDLRLGDYFTSGNTSFSQTATLTSIFANNAVFVSVITTIAAGEVVVFQRGLSGQSLFQGTAVNSQQLQGMTADTFPHLASPKNTFYGNIATYGNITLGNTFVLTRQDTGEVSIDNKAIGGNISLYANVAGSAIDLKVLNVYGIYGNIEVAMNPTSPMGVATKNYVDALEETTRTWLASNVATLVGTAPVGSRDFGAVYTTTSNLLASLGVTNSIVATKSPINSPVFTGNPQAPTPALTDSDNSIATTAYTYTIMSQLRANVAANVATLTTAVNLRANIANPVFTGVPTAPTAATGTNTPQIATTQFVTTAVQNLNNATITALNLKAPLDSPALTGVPTAPTAGSITTNTGQIATTQFVQTVVGALAASTTANATFQDSQIMRRANIASPNFTGIPTAPTAPLADSSANIATTAFTTGAINNLNTTINTALNQKAPLVSPALTGVPTAPTPTYPDNSIAIATTAYITTAYNALNANLSSGNDAIYAALGFKADKASPIFTGTPLSVTPPPGDNTTKIATTAYVQTELNSLASYAPIASPVLTGIPKAPTPVTSDNSTQIATTAFVQTAMTGVNTLWQGAHRFVSTNVPQNTQGVDGDVWFQV
jgi:hypothetical protein